ncbi:uncharacterized protein LOC135486873 [Lineus longissimus]|uniref:uncharacterized protein LOC135486873 n=1 Tax=Lineus longissimus TaxID=88925 RepID=UPI002B4EA3DD
MATIRCLPVIFLAIFCTTYCAKYAPETLPKPAAGGQTPFYSPEEMYQDIFPITKANFTAKVLKSQDAWIILFHDGTSLKSWKTMAVKLRGIVWVGAIHRSEQEDLLNMINFDPKKNPAARVYPHGGRKIKEHYWQDVDNPNTASEVACDSIPDLTRSIDKNYLNEFFVESYRSKPSKFPTLILETSVKLSPIFKQAAYRTQKYFNFGVLFNPTSEDFQAIGAEGLFMDVPGVLALVQDSKARRSVEEPPQIHALPYNSQNLGKLTYIHLIQFLVAVNRDYRYTLMGNSMDNNKTIVEMEDVLAYESKRFRILRGEEMNRVMEGKKEKLNAKKMKERRRKEKQESIEIPSDPYLKEEL